MLFYIAIAALVLLYWYYRLTYSRFGKYGVKHHQPLPLVGNLGAVIFRQKHFANRVSDVYFGFPGERFVGFYEFVNPVILIRDIELMKKIAIQDFESFFDHRMFISEEFDALFGRVLFNLRGKEWKRMHTKLSPLFTSSRIKQTLPIIMKIGEQFVISLVKMMRESKTGVLDADVKDLSNRYANDIAAAYALGMKVDSISEPNNGFYTMSRKTCSFSYVDLLKFLGYYSIPNIMKELLCKGSFQQIGKIPCYSAKPKLCCSKLFKISYLSVDTKDFFVHLVTNTMEDRKKNNIVRPDLIHQLMEARSERLSDDKEFGKDFDIESTNDKDNGNRAWTDNDLVAQAVLFIMASHETVPTTLTFLLLELALNPDVQEKLVQEIMKYKKLTDGKFDYDTIQTMPYLDMVLSESLRLWPPVVASDRLCTKEYNLGSPNDDATGEFTVKVGEDLLIPIMSIHRDPQYFPDPQKFDPERFSEKNKHKIKPFTYIPFGLGPRNCIGYRFATSGIKALLVQLLQVIEVAPCKKTATPVQLLPESITLRLKGGHWLRLKARASH